MELSRFARAAGFVGNDVTTATALALATSGGIAEYDFHAGSPGVGHYVGLWGIDVDRWTQYAGVDLHVPHRAAEAAYDLTQASGGWGWSPVHGTSHHHAAMAAARVSTSQELHHQTPSTSTGMALAGHRMAEAHRLFRQTREQIAIADLVRGL